MQRTFLKGFSIALLMSSAAYGQSLGDVARQNREKQSAQDASSAAKPKVITNANLPKDPDASEEPAEAQSEPSASGKAADHRSPQQRLAEQPPPDHCNRQLLPQENNIPTLQPR